MTSDDAEVDRLLSSYATAREAAKEAVNSSTDLEHLRELLKRYYPQEEIISTLLLRKISDLDPNDLEARILAASLGWQYGEYAEAYAALSRAEKIDPTHHRVLELKILLSFTQAEKIANLERLVEHYPDKHESARFFQQLTRERAQAGDGQKTLWPPGEYPPDRHVRFE